MSWTRYARSGGLRIAYELRGTMHWRAAVAGPDPRDGFRPARVIPSGHGFLNESDPADATLLTLPS